MSDEITRAQGESVFASDGKLRCSAQINEIVGALAKAQGAINNPAKKGVNPHFNSKFADLSMGINAIREGLSVNGLAVIQSTRMQGDVLMLDTRLAHSSGQWFEAEYPVCKLPAQPQAIGSALTYARRYSLFGIVGIAGEDDDGNAANETQTPAPMALVDSDQFARLKRGLDSTGTDETEFSALWKAQTLADIQAKDFPAALAFLVQKLKRQKAEAGDPNREY